MGIHSLSINNFRVFSHLEYLPSQHLNIIHGSNASGKTSFLEAICFLSRGKSFRTQNIDRVIQNNKGSLQVVAKIDHQNKLVPVGIQREKGNTHIRFNNETINRVSILSQNLPVQIIQPDSHKLVEEGPVQRRKYLDWGVFHVEQEFHESWTLYQKNLKQRNAALKQNRSSQTISAWDSELIKYANKIDQMRSKYVEHLVEMIPNYLKFLLGNIDFDIRYYKGWKLDESFESSLKSSFSLDTRMGFTHVGPHRADLKLQIQGVPATEKISRGQQKILVTTLLLSQAILYNKLSGKQCILLIDDVAAELDQQHQTKLIELLSSHNFQLFVTSIIPGNIWSSFQKDQKRLDLNSL